MKEFLLLSSGAKSIKLSVHDNSITITEIYQFENEEEMNQKFFQTNIEIKAISRINYSSDEKTIKGHINLLALFSSIICVIIAVLGYFLKK